jgi:hypothetical protein
MAHNPLLSHHDSKEESFLGRRSLAEKWWHHCLEPTTEWSGKQYFWIWQNTVLTCWASFGVSYLVGYLLITERQTLDDMLMNYVATAFMTPLLNWIIGGTLMSVEPLIGRVAVIDPRGLRWWPQELEAHDEPFKGRRWWFTPSDLVLEPSYYRKTKTCGGCICSYLQRIAAHVCRALPWVVISITLSVPIMYGFSAIVYGSNDYNAYPQPQIMTAVQALLISLFTIPIWARIALANIGSKLVHDDSYVDFTNELDPTGFNVA